MGVSTLRFAHPIRIYCTHLRLWEGLDVHLSWETMKCLLFEVALALLSASQLFLAESYEIENERILIDLVQNNPGDPVGWQMTKYADPQVLASLNYTAKMSTGENSPVLAINFSTIGSFFEENSVELAWMESYALGIDAFIERIHSAGLKAFFFVDMIVLPLKVIDHYKEQILNKDGNIVFNDVTAKILTAMFTETLQRFPGIDGFVVRTGETYVYDTPYHKGNSPTVGVKTYVDQQQIWTPFIKYLRDLICEEMKLTLLFRSWDNFGMIARNIERALFIRETTFLLRSKDTQYYSSISIDRAAKFPK